MHASVRRYVYQLMYDSTIPFDLIGIQRVISFKFLKIIFIQIGNIQEAICAVKFYFKKYLHNNLEKYEQNIVGRRLQA